MKHIIISVINDLVTDQRLHRMAGTLSDEGYRINLIGRRLRNSPGINLSIFEYKRFGMIFNKGPLFYASYNFRLFFYLLFSSKPVMLISIDLDTLLANYLVSRIRKIPLLYDSHEYFTEVPELIGRPLIQKIWQRIERKILPNLKFAISVSDSISNVYREMYGVNFITILNVSKKKMPISNPVSDPKNKEQRIIYQGALNVGRGIELMIRTMKWNPEVRLIIVGEGDISSDLKKLANDMQVSDRINFTGRIAPEELHGITSQCHLGLSLEEDLGLSYRMALPNKVFDYIQGRIPILCSDLPEMASLVRKYRIGEVCISREPELLSRQIRGMLTNTEAISEWALNLEQAAEELCWENEEGKLKQIVKSALLR